MAAGMSGRSAAQSNAPTDLRFTRAIVRRPCRALVDGLTDHPELGKPDYELALVQHDAYVAALRACGLAVTILPADERYPDSCFVEDVAVLTDRRAVLTNPGAPTRAGEVAGMVEVLAKFFPLQAIGRIEPPGTLEGGDVLRAGNRFYVGLSARTNAEGIDQFARLLGPFGYEVVAVPLREVLHLKTGVNRLEPDVALVAGEFITRPEFARHRPIVVPAEEAYAANSLWLNGTVLVPAGYPQTLAAIEEMGYPTIVLDTSEFRKVDGGLSCLSLRF